VHERDGEIIEAFNSWKNMCNFDVIEVPRGDVRSKRNTCNFELEKAKGPYLTIYEADDVPDKFQLQKAPLRFESVPENYACLQAALNYCNALENFLTKCVSVEYSTWYDVTLKMIGKFQLFSARWEQ
jgi:cellulose synthase/poly-beta-1,6-N-acetylglucosamine synthase-like glycosyltransferase